MSRSLATTAHSVGEYADSEFQTSLVRAIHEASPDGILVVNDNDIVVSHNQRFLEVWGIPREDLSTDVPGGSSGRRFHRRSNHRRNSQAVGERVGDRRSTRRGHVFGLLSAVSMVARRKHNRHRGYRGLSPHEACSA